MIINSKNDRIVQIQPICDKSEVIKLVADLTVLFSDIPYREAYSAQENYMSMSWKLNESTTLTIQIFGYKQINYGEVYLRSRVEAGIMSNSEYTIVSVIHRKNNLIIVYPCDGTEFEPIYIKSC